MWSKVTLNDYFFLLKVAEYWLGFPIVVQLISAFAHEVLRERNQIRFDLSAGLRGSSDECEPHHRQNKYIARSNDKNHRSLSAFQSHINTNSF